MGAKAKSWAIRRPLETACVVSSLRFRPHGGWGHLCPSHAPRELSTSPYPLAEFAQVGYRAVSRESKFANGYWGRSTWGRKQNRGLFDDRWKQLVS